MDYEIDNMHYNLGRQAFCDGRLYSTCPYPKGSNEWHLWTQGYSSAEFNNAHLSK